MQFSSISIKILISLFLAFFIISCAQLQSTSKNNEKPKTAKQKAMEHQLEKRDINLPPGSTLLDDGYGMTMGKLFGLEGLDSTNYLGAESITFDVALDQVDFMPLVSVDSISGVIITDWYSLDNGNTRIKINIRIIDQQMTDQSIIVSLFTQTLSGDRWIDNGMNDEKSYKIKESILSSARALKIASEL